MMKKLRREMLSKSPTTPQHMSSMKIQLEEGLVRTCSHGTARPLFAPYFSLSLPYVRYKVDRIMKRLL
jgi:hypothetical protein